MSETPEHILRQTGKVVRPDGCRCDDGFWMRTLVDPGCHYHSDYGEELREQLEVTALEEFVSACR
jgi:hypothetical protein